MAKVLIIADLKGRGCATPRGLELAAKLGLDADVAAITYASLKSLNVKASEHAGIKKRLLEEREQVVGERVERYRQEGQKVNLKVVWEKDVDKWVKKACSRGGYAAVVKTGSNTGSLVHTSTDWQLLRECPAPVLIVAEKKWHRTRPVLVTLDLGTKLAEKKALNRKVLKTAGTLADALGVELEIIAAIEVPTLLQDLDLVDPVAGNASIGFAMDTQCIDGCDQLFQRSVSVWKVRSLYQADGLFTTEFSTCRQQCSKKFSGLPAPSNPLIDRCQFTFPTANTQQRDIERTTLLCDVGILNPSQQPIRFEITRDVT